MNYKHFLYEEFPILLRGLKADTPALWGKMNAQQMVEHLMMVVGMSNGRLDIKANADAERLAYRKMRFFEKDVPIPRNFRNEIVPEEPNPVQLPNIEEAKMQLFNQLQRLDDYFTEHQGMTTVHGVFGPLNYEEWVENHARHFRHHLVQFGMIKEAVEN